MPFVAIYGKKYFVFYPLTGMEVEDKELFTYEEEVISDHLTGARSTLKYSSVHLQFSSREFLVDEGRLPLY